MAARVTISSSPKLRVGSIGHGGNAFRDRSTVMRPPRLKPLKTRDYGKASRQPGAAKLESGGAGFGQTGLTGET